MIFGTEITLDRFVTAKGVGDTYTLPLTHAVDPFPSV